MRNIWIKENDSFGFIGLAIDNYNNDMSPEEVDKILGEDSYEEILEINENGICGPIIEYLESKGWNRYEDGDYSNGDVHVYALFK